MKKTHSKDRKPRQPIPDKAEPGNQESTPHDSYFSRFEEYIADMANQSTGLMQSIGFMALHDRLKAIQSSPELLEVARIREAIRQHEPGDREYHAKQLKAVLVEYQKFIDAIPESTATGDALFFGYFLITEIGLKVGRAYPEAWVAGKALAIVRRRFRPDRFKGWIRVTGIPEIATRELLAMDDLDLQGAFEYLQVAAAELGTFQHSGGRNE